MYKIIALLTFFVVVSISAIAQNDSSSINTSSSISTSSFKPSAKSFTAEVNFDPFAPNPVSISYLRFRVFTSEKRAVRLGFSVGMQNQNPDDDENAKTFELNLRPGYEWHFTGTNRLSPYIGAELDFAIKKSEYESTQSGNEYTIDGAWSQFGTTERGYTRIGANFILGLDVYIVKRLYLGTEIGFGFENVKSSDVIVKYPGGPEDKDKGGSSFQIGPNYNSSIRLGFVF